MTFSERELRDIRNALEISIKSIKVIVNPDNAAQYDPMIEAWRNISNKITADLRNFM